MNSRHRLLLRHAAKAGCDTMVAFRPENIFYMTGFWGEAIAILQKGGASPVIVAPELEASRAEAESGGSCKVVVAERGMRGLAASAAGIIRKSRKRGGSGGGVCTDCRDYGTMTYLKRAVPGLCHTEEPFNASRVAKDQSEIRSLRRTSKIIDHLFEVCSQKLRVGQRESEMQAILMAEAASREAFDVGYASVLNPLIVAGGPNGALPHAQVSRRRFRRGDLVVVDLTLRHMGYVSDATRTFAVGNPGAEARDAYQTVRESQRLGLARARAGVACGSVDDACRSYITQAGHGAHFIHSTGHGVGLEVHEAPAVSRGSKTRLREGMAITVEPGIYVPGRFGIRIEDSLVVRGSGPPAVLHRFTKELVSV